MQEKFGPVELTGEAKVAVISLNNPATVNALSSVMIENFHAALERVEAGDFRCLILRGHGRGFCSGADLNELPQRQTEGAGHALERIYHPLLRRLRTLQLPIITAVHGAVVGIGVSLALMGDLIIAARSAYFLLSFSRIGLVPDGGASWLLPRIIGLTRAREMALLADKVHAEQALSWGLVNRVVDEARLMEEAYSLAQRLADGPAALLLTRKLFWDSCEHGYEEQLVAERQAQQQAGQTEDFWEGLAAFQQKRLPDFRGK